MAKKKLIIPKGIKPKTTDHFDTTITTLAKEHQGTYLIVSNIGKSFENYTHNRFYLHKENALEFWNSNRTNLRGQEQLENAAYYVLSDHPDSKAFIDKFLAPLKPNESRFSIKKTISGLNLLLSTLKSSNRLPQYPNELNEDHTKILTDTILQGKLSSGWAIRNLSAAWRHIRMHFTECEKLGTLPSKPTVEKQIEELMKPGDQDWVDYSDDKEVTLEMLFQLDYYTQVELERIMRRVNEYQEWMRELAEMHAPFSKEELKKHNGLFTRANLLKTFYSHTNHQNIRNYYIEHFGEDPLFWIVGKKKRKRVNGKEVTVGNIYPSKEAEKRHQELLCIAKDGIDLTIRDEKMFAWWQATIMPNYPLVYEISDEYKTLISDPIGWVHSHVGGTDYSERICPSIYAAHLMLIRLLIDSEANVGTIYNTKVYKKEDDTYDVGAFHFRKRMLNAVKSKNNTVPMAYIDPSSFSEKCIRFYTKWAEKLYERSGDKHFLQYSTNGKFKHLYSPELGNQNPTLEQNQNRKSKGNRFFERFEIYKTVERRVNIGTKDEHIEAIKERVHWINHGNIRAACNFRNYHLLFGKWKRQHVDLAHSQHSENVEEESYHQYSWQMGDEHQLAMTLNTIEDHLTGKVSNDILGNAFSQPHCDCKDNTSPDFEGAPKINEGEICTDYRNCLTKCGQSTVFADHHGPTHMAIQIIAEQERENTIRIEDWHKEWGSYLRVSKAVLRDIDDERKGTEIFIQHAYERVPFMRIFLAQNKRKMKIAQEQAGSVE